MQTTPLEKLDLSNIPHSATLAEGVALSEASRLRKVLSHPLRSVRYAWVSRMMAARALASLYLPGKGGGGRKVVRLFSGQPFVTVRFEAISNSLAFYRFMEEGLSRVLLAFLKPGMTFIDVGAHFGYFSLLASDQLGPSGRIHAFEPSQSTREIFLQNLSLNGVSNVLLCDKAVWAETGHLDFLDLGIQYSAFNSWTRPRLDDARLNRIGARRVKIDCVSLDDHFREHGLKPHFIKIDAESAEYKVLLGLEGTLRSSSPVISAEVGDFDLQGVETSRKVVEFLIERGYKAYEFAEGRLREHRPRERYDYDNLFFCR